MKVLENPTENEWQKLTVRPQFKQAELAKNVRSIMNEVKLHGDAAIRRFTHEFDGVELDSFRVTQKELDSASRLVPDDLKNAIELAKNNIEKFHSAQLRKHHRVETAIGVECWQKDVPIERVGLYIPGGSAPLFSTVLMLGIPAILAGCKHIILCSPPDKKGEIAPAILYTASLLGIRSIYKIGGAQAIAALTFGTESIEKVYKIFGPGNQYVTKAKELAQQAGVAIDMPAGPSELLLIADRTCIPKYVAADLLSQAEHGPDSQVVLLSNDKQVLNKCLQQVELQLAKLPRRIIAEKALSNSKAVLFDTIETCLYFSNSYAPEHLILATENAETLAENVTNAGSVFIGNYSCESAGDYASGTNHTLPTNGFARSYSGVSVASFCKTITFQKLTSKGIQNIGSAVEIMAEAEGLFAHKNAVTLRLKDLKNV